MSALWYFGLQKEYATKSPFNTSVLTARELQKIQSASKETINKPYRPDKAIDLSENTFSIIDLGTNLTGFISASIRCPESTKLYFTFDEIFTKDDVDFKRLGCVNAVGYELEPGMYHLESFEPYTMRYLKLNVLQGTCHIPGGFMVSATIIRMWYHTLRNGSHS